METDEAEQKDRCNISGCYPYEAVSASLLFGGFWNVSIEQLNWCAQQERFMKFPCVVICLLVLVVFIQPFTNGGFFLFASVIVEKPEKQVCIDLAAFLFCIIVVVVFRVILSRQSEWWFC